VRELAANIHATRAAAGPDEKKIQTALAILERTLLDALN
jgi:hypothetical protein